MRESNRERSAAGLLVIYETQLIMPHLPVAVCLLAILQAGQEPPASDRHAWPAGLLAELAESPKSAVASLAAQSPEKWQQLMVVADWLRQDGLDECAVLLPKVVTGIIDRLGDSAADLRTRLTELSAGNVAPGDGRWAGLYLDACLKRREKRLAPYRDRIRRIVFTKHYDLGGSHYAYTEGQSDAQRERHFQPGSALCLLKLNDCWGTVDPLIADEGGVIRDPDVSLDAERVLFAWKKSLDADDYHLYEIEVASGEVRQITSGQGFADYEGVYLPNGHIVFNSTRCVQTVDCWWTEVSNLFTCDGDGRFLRQIGFDQVHTNYPTVTGDGRVIYTRWDYNDRGQIYPQGLFQMSPDGTYQTEVYGNNSWFPTTILHARDIPGTGKIVCIFTGHHTRQNGWLGILDPSRGRQENHGAQLIAPVRDTPAVRIDRYGQSDDQFQYPYPLDERAFLAGLRPEGGDHFRIYFVREDGASELLACDQEISCSQPVPLVAQNSPPVRPNLVDYRKDEATVYLHDVYQGPGLAGIERGSVKNLRVVALEFRAAGVGSNRNRGEAGGALISTPISIEGAWDVKRVLGTIPVHEDGSACFVVPSRTPLYFQPLDEKGHMVQSMRSWVTLQPGESVSCVGCHEHKNTAPPVTRFSRALAAGPRPLKPFYGPPRGFSFTREIQPILDRHCVNCHHRDEPPPYFGPGRITRFRAADAGLVEPERDGVAAVADMPHLKPAFSLKSQQFLDPESQRKWSDSYLALAHRHVADWIDIQSRPSMLPPYHAGSAKSGLIEMLESGEHYGVRLAKPERDRFIVWIDLLVPYCGDYLEAIAEEQIPKYQHFLEKRRRWQAEEAENVRGLIDHRTGFRTSAYTDPAAR